MAGDLVYCAQVTARAMLAGLVPELIEARRKAGEAKRAIMRRRWEVKKKSGERQAHARDGHDGALSDLVAARSHPHTLSLSLRHSHSD